MQEEEEKEETGNSNQLKLKLNICIQVGKQWNKKEQRNDANSTKEIRIK